MDTKDVMPRLPDHVDLSPEVQNEGSGETIEERCFSAALVCLDGHFKHAPPMGPKTAARVSSMISKTLEKTHTLRKAR